MSNEEVEITNEILECLHEVIIKEHNLHLFSRKMEMASCTCYPNLLQFIGATTVCDPIILTAGTVVL